MSAHRNVSAITSTKIMFRIPPYNPYTEMKTEKKIEDYIHLYIGCEVFGTYNDKSGSKGILTGVTNGGHECEIQFILCDGINVEEEPEWNETKEVKLLLRSLSSMTKDDIDLGAFIPEFEILTQRFTGGYCIEIDSCQEDGYCLTIYPDGSMYCICKDNNENYPYKGGDLFNQLLKAGIDLFDLIPAGLAIDKKHL